MEQASGEMALMRRLGWRLLPLLILTFLVAFIDRQNVGFAKLQMLADLHISEASYGFGASLFFLGYVIFEVPSCLGLQRYGARIWLARLTLSWGLVTLLLACTSSAEMFYVLRFLLGAAEAGFYPGAVFYISLWFPEPYRIRMLGFFSIGSSLGNMFGALINGMLLGADGTLGLRGWQLVFVGSGMLALLLTATVLRYLPSFPNDALFLSRQDREHLAAAHARQPAAMNVQGSSWSALWDPTVLGFGLVYVLQVTAFYGVTYWLPTIVRGFGVNSAINGLLNMIVWAIGAVALLIVPRFVRNDRAVFRTIVGITLLGAVCFIVSILLANNTLRFLALAVGGPCIALLNPLFWIFPPRFLSGARAAAGIAAINSIGNIGGFLAQNLAPWVERRTGSVDAPMLVPAVCLTVICAGAVWLSIRTKRQGAMRTNHRRPI